MTFTVESPQAPESIAAAPPIEDRVVCKSPAPATAEVVGTAASSVEINGDVDKAVGWRRRLTCSPSRRG
ncbi:MAG: hypothetical protein R3B96_02250 [Pirellulaceae bacterium]